MRRFLFIALTVFAHVSMAGTAGFDVNDVSILFPLTPSTLLPYPEISVDKIVGGEVFGKVSQKSRILLRNPDLVYRPEKWRVVGLRLDPCFPTADKGGCEFQLRLVAQHIEEGEARPPTQGVRVFGLSDQAMHFLYKFNFSEFMDIVDAFRRLQKLGGDGTMTRGRSLQPHPGLVSELGNSTAKGVSGGGPTSPTNTISRSEGAMAKLLRSLIQKYCTLDHLQSIAMTGSDESFFGAWIFVTGDFIGGTWRQKKIPDLPEVFPTKGGGIDLGLDFSQHDIQASDNLNFGFPLPKAIDSRNHVSMAAIIDNGHAWGNRGRAPLPEVDALFAVLNPRLSNPTNTDCLSCHLNNQYLSRVRDVEITPTGHIEPFDAGKMKSRFINPFGITGFTEKHLALAFTDDNTSSQVRVFGYADKDPVVEPIVANSSADVAEHLNQMFGWSPPTNKDCSAPEVYSCFYGIGATARSERECLALCK